MDPNAQNLLSARTRHFRALLHAKEKLLEPRKRIYARLGKVRPNRILQQQLEPIMETARLSPLRRRGDGGGGALPRDDGELSKLALQGLPQVARAKKTPSFVLNRKGGRINK